MVVGRYLGTTQEVQRQSNLLIMKSICITTYREYIMINPNISIEIRPVIEGKIELLTCTGDFFPALQEITSTMGTILMRILHSPTIIISKTLINISIKGIHTLMRRSLLHHRASVRRGVCLRIPCGLFIPQAHVKTHRINKISRSNSRFISSVIMMNSLSDLYFPGYPDLNLV